MNDKGFKEGLLTYQVSEMSPEGLATAITGQWLDGFVAFANGELRLSNLHGIPLDKALLTQRAQQIEIGGLEGYVNEVNLWRRDRDRSAIEEIVAERAEYVFQFQRWWLEESPQPGGGNCWYRRTAGTMSDSPHKGGRRLFTGALPTVEVVWPQYRLNFFLTDSGGA